MVNLNLTAPIPKLRLEPTKPSSAPRPSQSVPRPAILPPQQNGRGFQAELTGALKTVSAAQLESDRLSREVQMDNPQVSLEQTMVAIQKSQVAFQGTLHVRNRLVQAYTDIMNMNV